MSSLRGFRLVQGVYWLFLGAWVGAMVMLAVAAPLTFKTIRMYDVSLGSPPYNQAALSGEAPNILAGAVVGHILRGLAVIQLVCAGAVIICVTLQCSAYRDCIDGGLSGWKNLLRLTLIGVPVLVLAIDQLAVTPRIYALRSVMFDPARPASERAEARQSFDVYHKLDERLVGGSMFLLAGAVLVSAGTLPESARAQRSIGEGAHG